MNYSVFADIPSVFTAHEHDAEHNKHVAEIERVTIFPSYTCHVCGFVGAWFHDDQMACRCSPRTVLPTTVQDTTPDIIDNEEHGTSGVSQQEELVCLSSVDAMTLEAATVYLGCRNDSTVIDVSPPSADYAHIPATDNEPTPAPATYIAPNHATNFAPIPVINFAANRMTDFSTILATDFAFTPSADYAPSPGNAATLLAATDFAPTTTTITTTIMPVTHIPPPAVISSTPTAPLPVTPAKITMKQPKLTKSGVPRKMRVTMQSQFKLAILDWVDRHPKSTQREAGERFGFARSTIGKDVKKWRKLLASGQTLD
ncbi:uncharacterized protein V1518DRAFT_429969 [Limtongia smithiae]|uniref:uncharacterized protein n=1 Tax=Limtongia smithiae TaxID=1125753 RepID=UPI0034CDD239